MNRRVYKTSIPPHAVEAIEEYHPNGSMKSASYFVDGEKVGYRIWSDGRLEYEWGMRGGVKHGKFYRFYDDGSLLEAIPYRDGREHGTGKQWSVTGRLLVTYKLVHGTGLDLWCDTESGRLVEEHYWPGDREVGYTRLWNNDESTIRLEEFFLSDGGKQGVWREWNAHGRLRRGFPRFYVSDRKVTKRQYLKACESDPTLPPYRTEDDAPQRRLPAEYIAQRRK